MHIYTSSTDYEAFWQRQFRQKKALEKGDVSFASTFLNKK